MEEKPQHWFRPIHKINSEIKCNPHCIEFLKMWSGETFIHMNGTAYWCKDSRSFNIESMMKSGITHYRQPYSNIKFGDVRISSSSDFLGQALNEGDGTYKP